MAAVTVNIAGNFSGLINGSKTLTVPPITSAAPSSAVTQVILASGANVITIPALPAPTGCVIQLAAGNTDIVTLKGVTGDTGIAIGKTGIMMLAFDPLAVPASFCLTSAGLQTGMTTITFF